MPFFGIDDNFAMHPKVVLAGNAAIGAWARMGSHCVNHGTDGFISEKEARIFATSGQITKLVECSITEEGVGLLEPTELNGVKGYIFHDWTQPDVETIRKRREVRAAAGRKGGQASAAARAAKKARSSKEFVQANASPNASPNGQPRAQPRAQPNGKQASTTEDIGLKELPTQVSTHSYVSDATARENPTDSYELATSERDSDLSPPVTVGASRLVSTIIRNGTFSSPDLAMLRILTSEGINKLGRSEDDMAECLRVWLSKPHLGAPALLKCLAEVDKRKLGAAVRPSTSDAIVASIDSMRDKPRMQPLLPPTHERRELQSGS